VEQRTKQMTRDKRRHARVNSLNLLSYACFDEQDQSVGQGMGRTLNVSESGILLETHAPLDTGCSITLSVGIEDDLVDIKGRVVFSKKNETEQYESGIEFTEIDETSNSILSKFIKLFKELK